MPRRAEGRSKSSKNEPEDLYGLFIQGIPRNVGWQDLKDHIRQLCPNSKVKHANVNGEGDGIDDGISHIIINGKEAAAKAYKHMATNGWKGKSVTVGLAKAEHLYESNQYDFTPIAPLKISPPARTKTLYNPNGPSKLPSTPPASRRGSINPYPPSGSVTPQTHSGYSTQAPSPVATHFPHPPAAYTSTRATLPVIPTEYQILPSAVSTGPFRRGSASSMCTYPSGYTSTCPSTAPSSTCSSQILTVPAPTAVLTRPPTGPASTRAIFIQNLDSRVTWQLLKDKLRTIGEVTRCEVKPEKTSQKGDAKKPKQWAIATFVDRRSAERAVRALDGTDWVGRRMRVKLDDKVSGNSRSSKSGTKSSDAMVDATTSKTRRTGCEKDGTRSQKNIAKKEKVDSGPLVVDGNRAPKYRSDETDDESDSDSSNSSSSSGSDDSDDGISQITNRVRGVRMSH